MGKQGSLIKRLTDVIISVLVLILSFPVSILAALSIKLESKGPALFVHERAGLNGKHFKMLKFRGMIDNALLHGPELTQINDSRITKLGIFLRATRSGRARPRLGGSPASSYGSGPGQRPREARSPHSSPGGTFSGQG